MPITEKLSAECTWVSSFIGQSEQYLEQNGFQQIHELGTLCK